MSIAAQTSIDSKFFNTVQNKFDFHISADTSQETWSAVAYVLAQTKDISTA